MAWTRHGTCNNCGHCCQTFARQPVVRDLSRVDDPAFYEARGFAPHVVDGRVYSMLWVDLLSPCPQHRDQRCAIYDTRPLTCQDYPRHPRDIVGTPCSYWFAADHVVAGGLGSAHPTTLATWLALEAS